MTTKASEYKIQYNKSIRLFRVADASGAWVGDEYFHSLHSARRWVKREETAEVMIAAAVNEANWEACE